MNLVLEIYPMVPYNKMSVLRVCCFCPVMGIQILFQRSGRGLKVPPQHTHSHLVEAKLCLGWECFWDSEGWNVLGQKETPYSFLHYWKGVTKEDWVLSLTTVWSFTFLSQFNKHLLMSAVCAISHARHCREWQRWIRWFFALTLLTVWCWEVQAYNYGINQMENELWTSSKQCSGYTHWGSD